MKTIISLLKEHVVAILFLIACLIFTYYAEALGDDVQSLRHELIITASENKKDRDKIKKELDVMALDAEVRLQILEVKTGAKKLEEY